MKRIAILLILLLLSAPCLANIETDQTGKSEKQTFAEDAIKQKAIGVAQQVDIYLTLNPEMTIADLQADPYFQEIAVQQVGKTGYTALTDYDALVCRFHKNPEIVDMDLSLLSEKLPGFWNIMSQTRGGVDAHGTYNWEEPDGSIKEKYMYIAVVKTRTADDVGLHVAATTYLDEYAEQKKAKLNLAQEIIKEKAHKVATQVTEYLSQHPEKTLAELKEDPVFQGIAVQQIGSSGYTTITDLETTEIYFSGQEEMVGRNLSAMKGIAPELWLFYTETMQRNCGEGGTFFDWPDRNGQLRQKYGYSICLTTKTADGKQVIVDASLNVDEFDEYGRLKQEKNNLLPWLISIGILTIVFTMLYFTGILSIQRNAVFLFFSLTLLCIIALFSANVILTTQGFEKDTQTLIQQYLEHVANTQETIIELFIEAQTDKIELLSQSEMTKTQMAHIIQEDKEIKDIIIVDNAGQVVMSFEDHNSDAYANENAYIKGRYQTNIEAVRYEATDNNFFFTISTPYQQGVLIVEYYITPLVKRIMDVESLGTSAESIIAHRTLEGDARFLSERKFANNTRDIIYKEQKKMLITQALQGTEEFFTNFIDYREEPVFAVTRYNEELNVGLVTKIDKREALSIAEETSKSIWFFTTATFLILALISFIMNKLVTQSLQEQITSKTQEVVTLNKQLGERVKERTKELEITNQNLEKEVKKRTKELEKNVQDLEAFNKLAVGREYKMIELKKEINKLKQQLKKK